MDNLSSLSMRDKQRARKALRTVYERSGEMSLDDAKVALRHLLPAKDGRAKTIERVGRDRWNRTAVVVPTKGSETLDLVDSEGNLIAHLVLHVFEPGHADIDIVLNTDVEPVRSNGVIQKAHPSHDYKARLLRFDGGSRQDENLKRSEAMVALDFHYPVRERAPEVSSTEEA